MTSINFKAIGLTRPGFKNARSRFDHVTFGFHDLSEEEADALLIQPPGLVGIIMYTVASMYVCGWYVRVWVGVWEGRFLSANGGATTSTFCSYWTRDVSPRSVQFACTISHVYKVKPI